MTDVVHYLNRFTTRYISKIYDIIANYDVTTLGLFFNKNTNSIKNMLGISDKDEFIEFAQGLQRNYKILQEINLSYKNWDYLDAAKNTFSEECDKEGYSYIEFIVTYTREKNGKDGIDNSRTVKFGLYVSKLKSNNPQYIVKVIE